MWWRFGPWEPRRKAILAVLRELRPDVVGLQEVWERDGENLAEWLADELGLHWTWEPSRAPGGGSGGSATPVWPSATRSSAADPSWTGPSRSCPCRTGRRTTAASRCTRGWRCRARRHRARARRASRLRACRRRTGRRRARARRARARRASRFRAGQDQARRRRARRPRPKEGREPKEGRVRTHRVTRGRSSPPT
ncbi:endonuclease/exonuclease/phosphatase family protein [Streptomyces flavofungini]|uniref:endonuclease/exonuclease/phosphatase family protein n=1 Tax=Streptomyces flavofungini TaxID=68200 RepID=UPI003F540674